MKRSMRVIRSLSALALVAALVSGCSEQADNHSVKDRDSYPTDQAPDPAFEQEVRDEIAAMVPSQLDPNKREFYDATPEDVAVAFLQATLNFDLANTSYEAIEADAYQWLTDDGYIVGEVVPPPWSEPDEWDELVKRHAVFTLTAIVDVTEIHDENEVNQASRRFLAEYTVAQDGKDDEQYSVTWAIDFDRDKDIIWRISAASVM